MLTITEIKQIPILWVQVNHDSNKYPTNYIFYIGLRADFVKITKSNMSMKMQVLPSPQK